MGKRARVFLAVMMISMAFGAYGVEATSRDVDESVTVRPATDDDIPHVEHFLGEEVEEDKDTAKEKEEEEAKEGTEEKEDKDADKRNKDTKKVVSLDLDESKSYIAGIADKDRFAPGITQLYNSNGKEAVKVRLPIGCDDLAFVSSDYGVFTGVDEDHPVCVSASAIYGKVEGSDALENLDVDSLLFDVAVIQSKNYDNLMFEDKFESYDGTFAEYDFKDSFKKSSIESIDVISGVYNGLEYRSMMCNFKDGSTAFSPIMYIKMTNTQWLELSSANIDDTKTMEQSEVERIWSTVLDYIVL